MSGVPLVRIPFMSVLAGWFRRRLGARRLNRVMRSVTERAADVG
jgi:hypothetical protein